MIIDPALVRPTPTVDDIVTATVAMAVQARAKGGRRFDEGEVRVTVPYDPDLRDLWEQAGVHLAGSGPGQPDDTGIRLDWKLWDVWVVDRGDIPRNTLPGGWPVSPSSGVAYLPAWVRESAHLDQHALRQLAAECLAVADVLELWANDKELADFGPGL